MIVSAIRAAGSRRTDLCYAARRTVPDGLTERYEPYPKHNVPLVQIGPRPRP